MPLIILSAFTDHSPQFWFYFSRGSVIHLSQKLSPVNHFPQFWFYFLRGSVIHFSQKLSPVKTVSQLLARMFFQRFNGAGAVIEKHDLFPALKCSRGTLKKADSLWDSIEFRTQQRSSQLRVQVWIGPGSEASFSGLCKPSPFTWIPVLTGPSFCVSVSLTFGSPSCQNQWVGQCIFGWFQFWAPCQLPQLWRQLP